MRLAILTVGAAAVVATAAYAATRPSFVPVSGGAHDCAAMAHVSIEGDARTVAVTGPCGSVRILGHRNTVSIERSASVDIRGDRNSLAIGATDDIRLREASGNVVRYRGGVTGSGPNVVIVNGSNNDVERAN